MTIQWMSGATASFTVQVCPAQGKRQTFHVTRPSGVPGAELDLQYARDVVELALLRQQAADAAYFAEEAARTERLRARYAALKANRLRILSCDSRVYGSIIRTECF
jgi:hypothetical protein